MIKIDVLIKAAEFLENSERSLIKLHDESSLSLSPSSPPSPQNSIKKESKDKFLSKSEKAIHNTLEKNRRAHLKKCFESLQKELPLLKDKKKATNLAILNYTLKFIQQSQTKDKENENEIVKLMQKQELLKNAQKKILCEIERESPSFKSLVYEQISTQTNYANLQENIEKARIDIESSVKVKSPIIESSNEMETICGETGNNFEGSPTIQNIENRIENGRSFYNEDSDDQLTKLKSLTTSSSSTPLVDQIKNFGNIRIDLESLSKKGILALSTLGEANFARFNKMQLLTLSSQLVENS